MLLTPHWALNYRSIELKFLRASIYLNEIGQHKVNNEKAQHLETLQSLTVVDAPLKE